MTRYARRHMRAWSLRLALHRMTVRSREQQAIGAAEEAGRAASSRHRARRCLHQWCGWAEGQKEHMRNMRVASVCARGAALRRGFVAFVTHLASARRLRQASLIAEPVLGRMRVLLALRRWRLRAASRSRSRALEAAADAASVTIRTRSALRRMQTSA